MWYANFTMPYIICTIGTASSYILVLFKASFRQRVMCLCYLIHPEHLYKISSQYLRIK